MCGIAGLVSAGPLRNGPAAVAAMTQRLAHRGPDGQGFVSIDPVTGLSAFGQDEPPAAAPVLFGHRRLAIIDLSPDGRQPMCLPDAPHWIVFNGEVYNYVELREELSGEFVFRSRTDTEVVLRAWQKWGPAALMRMRGMFAFALWDGSHVYLARDRMGIKPLYYLVREEGLYFASEIKAFVHGAGLALEIDPMAVAEYFTFQNLFLSRSFFKGVKLLEAGCFCRVHAPFDGHAGIETYWRPIFNEAPVVGNDSSDALRKKLENAVSIQLRSDVEVGSYLSGGLDTATIVALSGRPGIPTFTCGYSRDGVPADELEFDETARASRIARHFGAGHHLETLAGGDLPRLMDRVAYHLEEPRVGISYQNYYLCSKIAERVKVVLSGTGGDELFAGYVWRYQRVLDHIGPLDDFYCGEWTRLVPDERKAEFFSREFLPLIRGYRARDSYDAVMGGGAPDGGLNRALYFDMKTFLASLLIVEDHLSMAHSLESRVPLLDEDVVNHMLSAAVDLKLRKMNGSHEGKWILKRAMRDILPAEVLSAPKQGFIPPQGHWFRVHDAEYLRDVFLKPVTACYFAPGVITRYIDEHLSGRANHRPMLWSLLSFEMMHRHFLSPA